MELKVLILDDEPIILDGLCSFPWEMYGCRVIGSAYDGVEGLELAEKYLPDIILSDIKMPGMDGIEFSKRIKKRWPKTEIIFLTGYDNFSFAQQALKIGVCEYILKPVNFREMHEVVKKVSNRIFERQERENDYAEVRRKYKKSIPVLKSTFISDLIYGRLRDSLDMRNRMKLLNIKIDQYILAYGRIESGKADDIEPELFDFIVCNICEEVFKQNSIQVYSVTDTLGYCFIVVYPEVIDVHDCELHCVESCELIQKNILDILSCNISFGISKVRKNPYSMNMSFKQATDACDQSVYMGEKSNILSYRDMSDIHIQEWNITTGEKRRVYSELIRGNIETAKKIVDQIFNDCSDLELMRYSAMEVLIGCFQHMGYEYSKFQSDVEKANLLADSMNRIYTSHSRCDLLETLKNTLAYLSNKNKGVRLDHNQQTAQKMIEFIRTHYSEDLSLDTLSEHFKISKSYINRLFKGYTGKSFLDILLDCRMSRAEQLIAREDYKIYEVAEMVGYHDLSYFIKTFKKKYGVTPNVYRRL